MTALDGIDWPLRVAFIGGAAPSIIGKVHLSAALVGGQPCELRTMRRNFQVRTIARALPEKIQELCGFQRRGCEPRTKFEICR